MEKDWLNVLTAASPYEAELVKGMLKENNIESVVMNRRDSELPIGEAQVYVHKDNAEKARQLIDAAGMINNE